MNKKNATGFLHYSQALCAQRGVRLTPQRQQVLMIIAAADRPLGAYDILQLLQQAHPGAAPPTVYRALDFLQQQGLIHRLASLQAYLVCDHPHQDHQGQFLICSDCGKVKEVEDASIHHSLDQAASQADFHMNSEIVEIVGQCGHCRNRQDQNRSR